MQQIIDKVGAIHPKWMTVLQMIPSLSSTNLAKNHKSLQYGNVVPGVVVSGTGATVVVVCAVDGMVVVA